MSKAESATLRGRMQFYDAQLWARAGALTLEELDSAQVESAMLLSEGLSASFCGNEVWHVFTDACYERDGIAGLGAVLNKRGNNNPLEYWFAQSKQQPITQLELYAVVATKATWQHLARSKVTWFVDNLAKTVLQGLQQRAILDADPQEVY
eukprot:6348278-Amphidinium_carterae.1